MKQPLSLGLYRLATAAVAPAIPGLLHRRARRGKEDPARLDERLGRAGRPRPAGALVWLHAVSVGEGLSLMPLIERFGAERPDLALLVTTGTRAAAEVLAGRLPQGVIHQYVPVDAPGPAERFLDHWKPSLGVIVESELWPNLILAAKARGVRLALASGVSEKSFARWRRFPAAASTLLSAFDLILAREAGAATRLRALGGRVDGVADLKFGARPLPVDGASLATLRSTLGERRVVLAASTHDREDGAILDAFGSAKAEALLIIAPRHPERGGEIAALAAARGLKVGRRSLGETPAGLDVLVADTLGELGLWYRLASLAVIGGSLNPGVGGHNPLEPARLNCPFVAGPHVDKWPVYGALVAAGATRLIAPDRLADVLAMDGAEMARRAAAFVDEGDAAVREALGAVVALAPQ